ncbi:propionyl-CoA synthetase [Epibacterium ulvae]|uniref:Propionyl-CoA synthetase n=1 Tax=Epibacterium ulvae TaxID=1156985 RepID=A0A1G5PZM9_9RHOB|nr:propionyl-CoA synthetase [Epibacterium ulvae]SCZ54887.1 propionyl-CoA synthetase [Epibacterium ulvae]
MGYRDTYARWQDNPETFWMEAARDIDWTRTPTEALTMLESGGASWFANGLTNTCWNAVDRHVAAGRGGQNALIYDSPVTGDKRKITYAELQTRVAQLAGALRAQGIEKGDRVLIYMPMVPETIEAMLACGRIGAIHSVVFGGFAAPELAVRIEDARPKAILAASCGIEPGRIIAYMPLLNAALEQAEHQPDFCAILQRPEQSATLTEGRDLDWLAFQEQVEPADCLPVEGDHPSYILYTSGTTGQPKGVLRHTGGQLVALNWSMKHIYNVAPGDVFWAASDVGWVVGHSYICYGPLIHGNTTVIYEGKPVGTPDAGAFWRVISEHNVTSFFTAPTALRAIKREDPEGACVSRYNLSCLKQIFLAGERADPDTITWAQSKLNVPVVDHWWQTETGWAIAANPLGLEELPTKLGSPTVPMPGYQVEILNEAGTPVAENELGVIAIKLPLPPGSLPGLWQADERFQTSYLSTYPGYYATGDAGMIDEDGYLYIMSRTDDVINVAGHRLSTGAMEEVLLDHPDVAECAVIGISDSLKGQRPLGFLCLKAGCTRPNDVIVAEVVQRVREKIGPVAAFKEALVVNRLPKTRSGKVLRGTMVKIADCVPYKSPATIDDPAILDEIESALHSIGLAQIRKAQSDKVL